MLLTLEKYENQIQDSNANQFCVSEVDVTSTPTNVRKLLFYTNTNELNEPNYVSRSEDGNGAMTHNIHDTGHAGSTTSMSSIACCVQQSPSIQKHQKRKSNKIKLPTSIALEPNGSRHSVNDMSFEKQTPTMNNNENHDIATHVLDIQWNVNNGALAIALHKQTSLPTNKNEHYVSLHTRDNHHWHCKHKVQRKNKPRMQFQMKIKLNYVNMFGHVMFTNCTTTLV